MIGLLLAMAGAQEPAPSPEPPAVAAPAASGRVDVRIALDGPPTASGGTLVVQVSSDPTGQVAIATPRATQVAFEPAGAPTEERIGGRDVVRQRYTFTAPKGSYEIVPVEVTWTGPDGAVERAASRSLWVDLGVEPPRPSEIVDIVEPGQLRPLPWLVIGGVAASLAAGLAFAFRPRRAVVAPVAPPVPPDVAVLERWDRVRKDPAIALHAKSVLLAELFREYVEAVLGFEATARTTREVLDHLGSLAHLPEGNVERAKSILRATDRVKFAEERPGAVDEWLGRLDADLRGFVDSTRPVRLPGRPR